ncbi:ChaN family lipoprotein [Candidatus Cyanaurora vandensis]|uniref:ChaN family lipoprotein n=1 Tax=Candidatus Cyanaurora vandensis TaxID=2714958 RepID=UPI00257CF011|nr:ChaN family lipoprotein [Candidatus Cyanaurora vandensis]
MLGHLDGATPLVYTRRHWLKTILGATLSIPVGALTESPRSDVLTIVRDPQQAIKFIHARHQNTDLLYSVDYQFLSFFTTISRADLTAMADLVKLNPLRRDPNLQACLAFCEQTDLDRELALLKDFPNGRRPGSVFLESRGQNSDERNASIDRFGELLLPQRQPVTLAPLLQGSDVVFLGETHDQLSTHQFLDQQLALLKLKGFMHFGCEFVSADDQAFLDQYQPSQRPLLVEKLLWSNPSLYADLIERLKSLGIRPLALGQADRTLPQDGGYITENRNFQLAHHVLAFLRQHLSQKLVVLIGANHAGYSHDTFQGLRLLPRTHPVPDIPTLIHKYLPRRKVVTAMFESNRPVPAPIPNVPASYGWRYIRTELVRRGVTTEAFMIALPPVLEDRLLTSWERRYDYYFYLPPVIETSIASNDWD